MSLTPSNNDTLLLLELLPLPIEILQKYFILTIMSLAPSNNDTLLLLELLHMPI